MLKSQSKKILNRRNRIKQRLLDVATQRFAAKGPDGVSIDELIDETEIARTTFYTFYPSKEDLLLDIVRPVFERAIEELSLVKTNGARQTARGIADVYLALWEDNPGALIATNKLGMKYFGLIEDLHSQYSKLLQSKLKKLEKSGNLRNGNTVYSAQIIARTVVQFLEIYCYDEAFHELLRSTIEGVLLKSPK